MNSSCEQLSVIPGIKPVTSKSLVGPLSRVSVCTLVRPELSHTSMMTWASNLLLTPPTLRWQCSPLPTSSTAPQRLLMSPSCRLATTGCAAEGKLVRSEGRPGAEWILDPGRAGLRIITELMDRWSTLKTENFGFFFPHLKLSGQKKMGELLDGYNILDRHPKFLY